MAGARSALSTCLWKTCDSVWPGECPRNQARDIQRLKDAEQFRVCLLVHSCSCLHGHSHFSIVAQTQLWLGVTGTADNLLREKGGSCVLQGWLLCTQHSRTLSNGATLLPPFSCRVCFWVKPFPGRADGCSTALQKSGVKSKGLSFQKLI